MNDVIEARVFGLFFLLRNPFHKNKNTKKYYLINFISAHVDYDI